MAYVNAVFYMDYVNGSDTARTNLVPSNYANNGSGLVRVTVGSLGTPAIVTGACVTIAGTTSSLYAGDWKVTVINSTTIDLVGSTYTSNPASKGTCVPFGGDSWSNAWKTITSGATAARIAPGDIVRVAKSPAPISVGDGKWTGTTETIGGFPATKNITSSTNAIPVVVTINSHGYSNGDVIQIIGHTSNATANGAWVISNVATNTFELVGSVGVGTGGANGTAQKINSKAVVLSTTGQVIDIDRAEVNWTAGAGGDTTPTLVEVSTDGKSGNGCVRLTLDSSVQTSKLQAYKATGLINLSGKEKISFWIKNSASIVANNWTVTLCSDTAGATPVDTFAIPEIPSTGQWLPITIARNGGGALGSSIQSIAINTGSVAPTASSNILVDNFIACDTDGLNLQSLISKNSLEQGGDEGWYGIQSINLNVVLLDNDTNTKSNAGRGYSTTGTSPETVTTYIRETIKTVMVTANLTAVQAIQDSGTYGNNIQFQGGYNTSNSTQDGETFFDGLNGYGVGLFNQQKNFTTINLFNFYRYTDGIRASIITDFYIDTINNLCNNYSYGINFTVLTASSGGNNIVNVISNCNNNGNNQSSAGFYSVAETSNVINNIKNLNNNMGVGINFSATAQLQKVKNLGRALNNGTYGISNNNSSLNNFINNALLNYNGTASVFVNSGSLYLKNVTFNGTETGTPNNFSDSKIFSEKHNGTAYSKIYTDGGNIVSQASTLTNGSGTEWKFTTETNTNRQLNYPLTLSIAKIAVTANNLVTVKAWFKKGHATNIGAKLVCRGGQIAGVTNDVTATKANDTSEEELTITFTPTEAGVVEIEAWAYYIAGHSTVIVDAMTITQA